MGGFLIGALQGPGCRSGTSNQNHRTPLVKCIKGIADLNCFCTPGNQREIALHLKIILLTRLSVVSRRFYAECRLLLLATSTI